MSMSLGFVLLVSPLLLAMLACGVELAWKWWHQPPRIDRSRDIEVIDMAAYRRAK